MSEYLMIGVRFNDEEMVMLQADVASAGFQGHTEAYSSYPELDGWLADLRGFSRVLDSEVLFDVGAGRIRVALARLDWSGHCACRVSLVSDQITVFNDRPLNALEVRLVLEPSAVDRFVKELEYMVAQQAGEATLKGLAQG